MIFILLMDKISFVIPKSSTNNTNNNNNNNEYNTKTDHFENKKKETTNITNYVKIANNVYKFI